MMRLIYDDISSYTFRKHEMRMVIIMTKGEILADLVSHGGISQTIVKLQGFDVQERLMGILMRTPWNMDAEVHYFFRPNFLAPDGVQIEVELAEDISWMC